jgi:hypothetical protein
MLIRRDLLDDWVAVRAHLPPAFDLERKARDRGAFTRARQIKDAATLLRLALAYGGCGMSLRETCAWAEAAALPACRTPRCSSGSARYASEVGRLVEIVGFGTDCP